MSYVEFVAVAISLQQLGMLTVLGYHDQHARTLVLHPFADKRFIFLQTKGLGAWRLADMNTLADLGNWCAAFLILQC